MLWGNIQGLFSLSITVKKIFSSNRFVHYKFPMMTFSNCLFCPTNSQKTKIIYGDIREEHRRASLGKLKQVQFYKSLLLNKKGKNGFQWVTCKWLNVIESHDLVPLLNYRCHISTTKQYLSLAVLSLKLQSGQPKITNHKLATKGFKIICTSSQHTLPLDPYYYWHIIMSK